MAKTASTSLDLRHLRYFVALAEELHFGRAAARLGISQPPLSEQILGLEALLGTRLLQRTKRSVALTSSGRVLHEEAVNLLAHADRVRLVMAAASSGHVGPLFLGCVPSSLFGVLPDILYGLQSLPGGLDVRVTEAHTTEIIAAVLGGRFDAGLVWDDRAPAPLSIRPLERVRLVAVVHAAHPLAARKTISLKDIAVEPLILPPRAIAPYHFDLIHGAFRKAGLEPRVGQIARSIAAQLSFVASKLGYALVPEYATKLGIQGIQFVPLNAVLDTLPLSLVWNNERPSSQLAAFRDKILQEYPAPRRAGAGAAAARPKPRPAAPPKS
jgi:DNA-binding transcriptional LysR family regulator